MDKVGNNSKLFLFATISLIVLSYSIDVFAEDEDTIEFLEESYPHHGTAVIRVTDSDANLNPEKIDNFDIDVWSDTDFAGIDLTVTETSDSSGIFEGTVYFSTSDDSSGHRLRITEGDTIFSKYDDVTIPKINIDSKLVLINTAMIQGDTIPMTEDRISLDRESYAWGDVVSITIIAHELNLDRNSIEKIDDSEKSSIEIMTRHFEIDDYNLIETGSDSGIFVGDIILLDTFGDNDSDGISVFFEYDEDKMAIGSAPIILNSEPESIIDERCGVDTVSIDGVCQVVKTKTVGDDAPFFGIFVYLDDLISWIFG